MKSLSIFLVAATIVAFVSCSKDDKDTTKPVITIDEPADNDTLFIGYETHLEMELSDDVMLKSYKVDIHSNFDSHGHAKSASVDSASWTYTKSWDVSGWKNKHIHHHEIEVPTTVNGLPIAKGKYHFMIYCTDEAGNESYVAKHVVIGEGVPSGEE